MEPDTAGPTEASGDSHPGVDAVLRALDGIAERPVAEQVRELEAAEARLRGLLNEPS